MDKFRFIIKSHFVRSLEVNSVRCKSRADMVVGVLKPLCLALVKRKIKNGDLPSKFFGKGY